MLSHTIRRRVLKTSGSGADLTTTEGGLPAGFTAGFAGALAVGAATFELCWSKLLSTLKNLRLKCDRDHIADRSHFNAAGFAMTIQLPATQGLMSL